MLNAVKNVGAESSSGSSGSSGGVCRDDGSGDNGGGDRKPQEEGVVFYLRDSNPYMIRAWTDSFSQHVPSVKISQGDIFKGAPAADAIVSPANSFGFMDGGIDMAYSIHFGWQLMERLQEEIRTKKDGELLVGDSLIVPIYKDQAGQEEAMSKLKEMPDWETCNEGQPIKYLISVPTMRTPQDVVDTVNAYLAFRAVILAVKRHNAAASKDTDLIRSVLCPGLGTAVGRMPHHVCASQMLQAYETFQLGLHKERVHPPSLYSVCLDESHLKRGTREKGGMRQGGKGVSKK